VRGTSRRGIAAYGIAVMAYMTPRIIRVAALRSRSSSIGRKGSFGRERVSRHGYVGAGR